ncbi:Wadjet anti-phage system protein JetD domain-containing protein [Mycolicibacterium setense]
MADDIEERREQTVKTVDHVRVHLDRWLNSHLHAIVAGDEPFPEPLTVPLLPSTSKSALQKSWHTVQPWAATWFAALLPDGVTLRETPRRVGTSLQEIPTHIDIATLDACVQFAGASWTVRREQAQYRFSLLQAQFDTALIGAVFRRTRDWDALDFDILLRAANWFRANPTSWQGLTPRQVPIAGVHAKWLTDSKRREIAALAGIESIDLAQRPSEVRFRYCDPQHIDSGGRQWDSHTLGDNVSPVYQPRVVVLCENKDTALLFPRFPGLISVWTEGNAAHRVAQLDWVARASTVLYWGDIDADGYEILDRLRQVLPTVQSILMDAAAYEQYEQYGTSDAPGGRRLAAQAETPLGTLTDSERSVYRCLVSADWPQHRRVEQERIPFPVAIAELQRLTTQ